MTGPALDAPTGESPAPRRRSGVAAAVLVVLVSMLTAVLTGVAGPAVAAGAQPGTGTGGATITVVEQDPWVGPRGELRMVVDVVTDAPGALQVHVHDAVGGRDEILRPTNPARTRQVGRLDPVAVSAGRSRVTVRLAVVPEADGTFGDPLVLDAGVYPVHLDLARADGSVVTTTITHLVRLPADEVPRPVALVVPLHADPDRSSDGRTLVDPEVRAQFDRRLATLTAAPTVPASLVLTPETANALAGDRSGAGLATLGRVAEVVRGGGELVTSPFVRVDVASWYRPDGVGILGALLDLGRATLEAGGFAPIRDTLAVGDQLTDDQVRWFADRGVRQLVVPAGAVSAQAATERTTTDRPTGDGWASAPVRVESERRTRLVPVIPIGTELATTTGTGTTGTGTAGTAGADTVLAAHRTLAALAFGLFDPPPAQAGWALELRADPATDAGYLRTVLDALRSPGPFTMTTVSDLATTPAEATVAVTTLTTPELDDLQDLPRTLESLAWRLTSVSGMVGEQPLVVRARGLLLVAASRDLPAEQRQALLGGVDETVVGLVGSVTLPRDETIVVTSHRARLPIVIRYDGPEPIAVAVTTSSPDLEIEGPNPIFTELEPGANDLELPIRSRRSGAFEVRITASSPDGGIVLGTTRLTVQSRAISGVGVLLSVGALTFLVLWWLRNHRRRRARPGATPEPGGATADTPRGPTTTANETVTETDVAADRPDRTAVEGNTPTDAAATAPSVEPHDPRTGASAPGNTPPPKEASVSIWDEPTSSPPGQRVGRPVR